MSKVTDINEHRLKKVQEEISEFESMREELKDIHDNMDQLARFFGLPTGDDDGKD